MGKHIQRILSPLGVEWFGVCAFGDCLPLLPCRAASRIPEAAQSVIVCLFPYYTGECPGRNVARYAVLDDYHRVAGEILQTLCQGLGETAPQHSFVPFVDNSPIREVAAAHLAGLGVVGKSGQLIHPVYGSYAFLGTVVTTLKLQADRPMEGGCRSCRRCIAACPTGALSEGSAFQKERCLSHITQKKGELSPWEREQVRLGKLAWGCDHCLDACPANQSPPITPIQGFHHRLEPVVTQENLHQLLQQKSYGYRGPGVLSRNLHIINQTVGS